MYLVHKSIVVLWMLLHLVLCHRYVPDLHETGFKLPSIFESLSDPDMHMIKHYKKHQIVTKQVVSAENSANNATCSNIGHLIYDNQQKDVCSGYFCTAMEALCEGSTIEIAEGYQTAYNISTQCTISKILCNNDSQIYDMSSQFGSQNCIIEKVKCGSEEIFAPNVNNTMLQICNVQVVCDEKTLYGYEYFGFFCEQQQLSCTFTNGSTILLPANLTQVDQNEIQNCSVLTSGCSQENLNGTTSCLDYNVECEGDSINECEFHVERLSCSSEPSCKVSLFMCNGTVLNATDVNGSLDGCSVVELNCENGTQQLYPNTDFNAENCTISQMICNGVVVNDPQAYSGQLFQDFCNVTRLKCVDNTSLCSVHKLACSNEPNCSISVSEFSCVNPASCLQQVNETRCACPIDYMGEECEKPRSLACTLFWMNNGSVCESVMKQTPESNPSCSISSQNQEVSLCFDLDCEFATTPTTSEQAEAAGENFTYFLQSEKFNLSLPIYWNMKLKIFNFNMLSDNNELYNMSLDKTQMQGLQNVCWNLPLGNVSEQYWFGDRLYIEIAWNGISPSGISSGQNLERLFIDSPYDQGVSNSNSSGGSSDTALIVGIVFGVLGFGMIVLVWKNRHYVFTKITQWVTKKY